MEMTTDWVVARIDELRNESHISEYKLCQRAGIGTSTISSMKIRKTWPKVQTMISICEALDVTLSDFFKTEGSTLVYTVLLRLSLYFGLPFVALMVIIGA